MICSVPECGDPVVAKGYCSAHYRRWMKSGDPLAVKFERRKNGTAIDLDYIFSQSLVDEHGCWIWQKYRTPYGYGEVGIADKKTTLVHRLAWKLANGRDIPEGLQINHKCERGKYGCCNPDHLYLGTQKDNMNEHGVTGDRHHGAIVPDDVVADTVRRYRAGGVTYRQLADDLVDKGYHGVLKTVVGDWCSGRSRKDSIPKALR